MRKQILLAIAFALSFGGEALAQQAAFIVQDERFEPCRAFKMKVLIPADSNRDISRRKPVNSLDPKMIFNPCPSDNRNLVVQRIPPKPENRNNYVLVDLDSLEGQLKFKLKPAQPPESEKSPLKPPDQQ